MRRNHTTPFGNYYNQLNTQELKALADAAGTSRQYLYMLASGRRQAGLNIASRLMAADDRITLPMLRPTEFEE